MFKQLVKHFFIINKDRKMQRHSYSLQWFQIFNIGYLNKKNMFFHNNVISPKRFQLMDIICSFKLEHSKPWMYGINNEKNIEYSSSTNYFILKIFNNNSEVYFYNISWNQFQIILDLLAETAGPSQYLELELYINRLCSENSAWY